MLDWDKWAVLQGARVRLRKTRLPSLKSIFFCGKIAYLANEPCSKYCFSISASHSHMLKWIQAMLTRTKQWQMSYSKHYHHLIWRESRSSIKIQQLEMQFAITGRQKKRTREIFLCLGCWQMVAVYLNLTWTSWAQSTFNAILHCSTTWDILFQCCFRIYASLSKIALLNSSAVVSLPSWVVHQFVFANASCLTPGLTGTATEFQSGLFTHFLQLAPKT